MTTATTKNATEVINVEEMENMLMAVRACTAIAIEIESEPKMNKTDNPFLSIGVRKIVTLNGLIGLSYENSVNNQLAREDKDMDFTAHRPVWFEYLPETRIVGTNRNKPMEKLYMAMKVQSASKPIYKDGMGNVITDKGLEILKQFLPKASKPNTQANLDEEIVWRTITLRNIQVMRIHGTEFVVSESNAVQPERLPFDFETLKQLQESANQNVTQDAIQELTTLKEASKTIRQRITSLLNK